jgi:hypothetical protein
MKKYLPFVSALVLGFFFLGSISTVRGLGSTDALMPKEISKEEAAKKYPPPNGKSYPNGQDNSLLTGGHAGGGATGFIKSPYSSRVYDCRKLKRGTLVLDEGVNKVFVAP